MSTLRDLFVRSMLVLLLGAPLIAQVGTQGSILGAVVDSSKAALPGATVVATNLDTGIAQEVDEGYRFKPVVIVHEFRRI